MAFTRKKNTNNIPLDMCASQVVCKAKNYAALMNVCVFHKKMRELLSNFHMNSQNLGFHTGAQKLEPPCIAK